MDDEVLKTYIPIYGDRLAATVFSKSHIDDARENDAFTNDRQGNVLERLRKKVAQRKRKWSLRSDADIALLTGNKNARKTTRRIELGWMDFEKKTGSNKQVRNNSGGGTRHLSIDKDLKKEEILATGKTLFFPDGISGKGRCVIMFLKDD